MGEGGHLEKFTGQNPRNSKKQEGHGKRRWTILLHGAHSKRFKFSEQ